MKTVSVLIPAYNEEEKIAATIDELFRFSMIKEVVVVDDGSRDNTTLKASKAGAKVVRLPYNQGKGAALNAGASSITGEVVLLLDADLGATASEALKLLEPIQLGTADLTIAKFPKVQQKCGFGLVKKLATWCVYKSGGVHCTSVLSGQRAMKLEVFRKLLPFSEGYSVEVASTIRSAMMGLKIEEIPVQMTHRVTGRDLAGFCHRGKQFWQILLFYLSKAGTRC